MRKSLVKDYKNDGEVEADKKLAKTTAKDGKDDKNDSEDDDE